MINSTLESGMFPFFGMAMQSERNHCPQLADKKKHLTNLYY